MPNFSYLIKEKCVIYLKVQTTKKTCLNQGNLFFFSVALSCNHTTIVFCCIVAWIQPDISCCKQNLLVWRKPRENLWNCSRKYNKMFKTDSFLGNKKLSLNQNVWRDRAIMQQDVLLHFWVIFLHWKQAEIWKKYPVFQL